MGRADMAASSDVVWGIIRKNSSFLVKRNFLELSSEPGNLMNKNSFKFSGLANAEAVDIQDNEKGITFSTKNKNSFKFSGLANAEAVYIQENDQGITFSTKN